MRTMISDILAQAGFEVVGEAETGSQAVERYKQLKPDLVTMDIVMPDMGGIDAVREIGKHDPDAKILMCSAMGQQALVVEAIQAGAKDLVVKPFKPSRLLEAVQRGLGEVSSSWSTPSCSGPPLRAVNGKPTSRSSPRSIRPRSRRSPRHNQARSRVTSFRPPSPRVYLLPLLRLSVLRLWDPAASSTS